MTFKKMDKVNWDAVMSTNLDSTFNCNFARDLSEFCGRFVTGASYCQIERKSLCLLIG
jgi:hypothetical protein